MELKMEKEKNMIIMVTYYLMENLLMEKYGMEKPKNINMIK